MQRIIVIESPGAGKSVFSKELDETFKETIINFRNEKLPRIYEMLDECKEGRNIIIFKSREEADKFIEKIRG